MNKLLLQRSALLVGVCAIGVSHALAQTVPDAGTLLREQPKPATPMPAPASVLTPGTAADNRKDTGFKVLVKGFRYQGATLIAVSELDQLLAPYLGKELSLKQLHALAATITSFYGDHGYIARTVLPPQEIKDGIVTFRIIEGKRGGLSFRQNGNRVPLDWVKGLIDNRLGANPYLDLNQLGEAAAILNEQPGMEAEIELLPGQREGEVGLNVLIKEKPLVSTTLGVSNQAPRATGEYQAQGSVTFNNLSGNLDAASLLAVATEGSAYARGDYSLPVGMSGLRVGANASALHYRVTQADLSALDPNGTATTFGLGASYPLIRRHDQMFTLTASADSKKLVDNTTAGETSNRKAQITNLGIYGWLMPASDQFLGGGKTTVGAAIGFGSSHQHNAGALAADDLTRRVEGNFTKLDYTFGHLRPLNKDWTFDATLHGQFADKNLDSTERFSLGGPWGIRAYPVGEGTGDEGWLLNVNFRRRLSEGTAATLFLDTGGVTVNHNVYAGWNAGLPQLKNNYQLSGVGAGLDWHILNNALLNATLATPLGSNPGRDANNNDVDGRNSSLRFWLSLNAQF